MKERSRKSQAMIFYLLELLNIIPRKFVTLERYNRGQSDLALSQNRSTLADFEKEMFLEAAKNF
jgi:hypothetical protein